jgi:hypothetical protein
MKIEHTCLVKSDNEFGPRVDINCRSFDFNLLFEDAFFAVLPAAMFLLILPARVRILYKEPVKVTTYRSVAYKFVGRNVSL